MNIDLDNDTQDKYLLHAESKQDNSMEHDVVYEQSSAQSSSSGPVEDKSNETNSEDEKISVLTKFWSKLYRISLQENLSYFPTNERKFLSQLIQTYKKFTPKDIINLDELKNCKFNLRININDVKLAINKLNNIINDPDKLKKIHYKHMPDVALQHLAHMFECCLATGHLPEKLKDSHMLYIPKDGTEKGFPINYNYKHVSIFNINGLIFGKIITNKLSEYLETRMMIKV